MSPQDKLWTCLSSSLVSPCGMARARTPVLPRKYYSSTTRVNSLSPFAVAAKDEWTRFWMMNLLQSFSSTTRVGIRSIAIAHKVLLWLSLRLSRRERQFREAKVANALACLLCDRGTCSIWTREKSLINFEWLLDRKQMCFLLRRTLSWYVEWWVCNLLSLEVFEFPFAR